MRMYNLDPLRDTRWADLVASHPQASVFHKVGWLKALARTYGYRPVVLTSSPPEDTLSDGIVFCEVKSWITGSRLVSLPFSDHAQPLLREHDEMLRLPEWLQAARSRFGWKYVELRPIVPTPDWRPALETSKSFWLHTLSLQPPAGQLFSNTHKSSIRRRIHHAEHENLEYERGASTLLIDQFYRLLVITRKRHRLLPQPRAWFENLMSEMAPDAEIRLARKAGTPVAAILCLRHRNTVVYKYGCSDHLYHHLAGMPFLLWKLIEESKAEGAVQVDFGRSDFENEGLARFKDRLGTSRTTISYLRSPELPQSSSAHKSDRSFIGDIFGLLPGTISSGLGRIVYRHIG